MRALILFFPALLSAQSCSHQMTRTPNGPVLVYRNGVLQRQGADYASVNAAGTNFPILTPLLFADQDLMSAVITRAVPLSFTIPGPPPQTITYFSYALWREDWECSGNLGLASGALTLFGSQAGGFGLSVPDSGTPLIIMLAPQGDGTGKIPQDSGVVPCPKLDPRIAALSPVCHQFVWVTPPVLVGSVPAAQVGDMLAITLQATPACTVAGCDPRGIRIVLAGDGQTYYLVDVTGNQE